MPSIKKYKKHLKKLHKKISRTVIVFIFLLVAIPFLIFLGSAQASSSWDLTGAYTLNIVCVPACSTTVVYSMTIVKMDIATGDFSGSIYDTANPSVTATVSGNVKDSNFTIKFVSTGESVGSADGSGTISQDGSLSGTGNTSWGQAFNFNTTSGFAKPVTKDSCKKEGWASMSSKNQGQCIKNFNLQN